MNRECTSKDDYLRALKELRHVPIVGEHNLGELQVTVSGSCGWLLLQQSQGKWHRIGVGRSNPKELRDRVERAVIKWLKARFQ